MNFTEALAKAAADLDVVREECRQRFERSLIENHCPDELLEDMREYEASFMEGWRERALDQIRECLLREVQAETVH